MVPTAEVSMETTLALLGQSCKEREKKVVALQDDLKSETETRSTLETDLKVALGELKTQIRITWVLLLLVISGLIGVAFSMWRGV